MYTKDNYLKDFEAGNIKLIKTSMGRSREYGANYNRYSVYAGDLKLTHYNTDFMANIPYYSKRSETMAMTVWGMSQDFEARAKLTNLAMYHKLKKYNRDYFYAHVDTDIKVLY